MTSSEFKRKLLEEFWTPSRSDIMLKVGDKLIGVDDVYLDDKCNIIIEASKVKPQHVKKLPREWYDPSEDNLYQREAEANTSKEGREE